MIRTASGRRRGALAVEAAVVYPVMFLLLFGLIVGGLGVFRYQQLAWLAHEVGRVASVRGADYQKETGKKSPTRQQLQDDVVRAMAVGFDPQRLGVAVEHIDGVSGAVLPWDSSSRSPTSVAADGTR